MLDIQTYDPTMRIKVGSNIQIGAGYVEWYNQEHGCSFSALVDDGDRGVVLGWYDWNGEREFLCCIDKAIVAHIPARFVNLSE